jgi:serine/threonine-protein kinase
MSLSPGTRIGPYEIHSLEVGSGPALVMELVEGPTLADRVAAGPMPIDEALAIARQIADALEPAHEKSIASARKMAAAI